MRPFLGKIGNLRTFLLFSVFFLQLAFSTTTENNPLRVATPGAGNLESTCAEQPPQQPPQQQQQQQQQQEEQEEEEERENKVRVCVGMEEAVEKRMAEVVVVEKKRDRGPPAAPGSSAEVAADVTAPASVAEQEDEEDDGYIPERYVVGCGGDRVEAGRRWQETVKWRKENKVDEIIETPQPRFHDCRQVFPVFLHGRSKKGMPVLWERIGKVNIGKADELKLPLPALTPNYVFFNECVWRVVLDKGEDDNDDAQFITVEDVAGVRPWHLTPKVLTVLRALTGTMKAHYVERCHKSYIINAPRAFTALWRVVSAMLDARTRAKISILGTDFLGKMQEDIDLSQIPREYGGSSDRAIDDSDDERKIQALVARLNAAAEAEGAAAVASSTNS